MMSALHLFHLLWQQRTVDNGHVRKNHAIQNVDLVVVVVQSERGFHRPLTSGVWRPKTKKMTGWCPGLDIVECCCQCESCHVHLKHG